MSVTLYEPGLFELLDSPAGPTSREVTEKAFAAAAFARDNVTQNFNTRSGNLLGSIGVFPSDVNVSAGLAYEVGTDGAPYGRILELGGEEHEIYAVNRRRLFSEPDNPTPLRNIMLQVVNHPGPQAKPWLVPAFISAGFELV